MTPKFNLFTINEASTEIERPDTTAKESLELPPTLLDRQHSITTEQAKTYAWEIVRFSFSSSSSQVLNIRRSTRSNRYTQQGSSTATSTQPTSPSTPTTVTTASSSPDTRAPEASAAVVQRHLSFRPVPLVVRLKKEEKGKMLRNRLRR